MAASAISNSSDATTMPYDDWMWYIPGRSKEPSPRAIAFVIVPAIFSLLSLVCCVVMIRESVFDLRRKNRSTATTATTICKQIISLQVAMILFTFPGMFGPVPSPSQTKIWGSLGTVETCTVQGFLRQIGLLSTAFQYAILIYLYVFIVCLECPERKLQKHFCWSNILTWIISVAQALAITLTGNFNSTGRKCGVEKFPYTCDPDATSGQTVCIRGAHAGLIKLVLSSAVRWPLLIAILVGFGLIYIAVRKVEIRAGRYAGASSSRTSCATNRAPTSSSSRTNHISSKREDTATSSCERGEPSRAPSGVTSTTTAPTAVENRSKSRAVSRQAMLYTVAFLVAAVPGGITNLFESISDGAPINYGLDLTTEICEGMFGFLCFLVFASTRKKMKTHAGRILRHGTVGVAGRWLQCCCVTLLKVRLPSIAVSSSSAPPTSTQSGVPGSATVPNRDATENAATANSIL